MIAKSHITLRQRPGQDCKDFFFDNFVVGVVTTDHPASSYGQPVVLMAGATVNYSDIESLTVEADDATVESVREKLEPFGVRVSRADRF